MTATARLDLRLNPADKDRISRAADLCRVPVSVFVRETLLREAEAVIASPPQSRRGLLSAHLRGRATVGLSTDEILRLTRSP